MNSVIVSTGASPAPPPNKTASLQRALWETYAFNAVFKQLRMLNVKLRMIMQNRVVCVLSEAGTKQHLKTNAAAAVAQRTNLSHLPGHKELSAADTLQGEKLSQRLQNIHVYLSKATLFGEGVF